MDEPRRSSRRSTAKAVAYAEDSSSPSDEPAAKRNSAKTTRRKRVRADDDEAANDDDKPSSKKGARSKAKRTRDEEADADDESPPPPKRTKAKPKASKPAAPAPKPTSAAPPVASSTNRDAAGQQEVFWLLKAEPLPRYENGVNVAFSIDDLRACTVPEPWTGVRNAQARNNMQAMRVGDLGFFYHSNAKPSGVVGILRVVQEAVVDETAFDPKDPYYDPKSERDKPKWFCVGVEFVRKFDDVVDLKTIKEAAGKGGPLEGMQLVTNGRLSVSRVRREEWEYILGLAGRDGGEEAVAAGQDDKDEKE